LRKNPYVLEFIDEKDQTEELCLIAVKLDSHCFQYAKKQNLLLCQIAINDYCFNINYINEKVLSQKDILDLWKIAINKDGYLISYTKQIPELIEYAIKIDPLNLKHIKNPSEKQCLDAIKKNPSCIKHIKNLTKEMCLLAVSLDGSVFKYMTGELDYDILLTAINNNHLAVNYLTLTEMDKDLCKVLCMVNPKCKKYILDEKIKRECKELLNSLLS